MQTSLKFKVSVPDGLRRKKLREILKELRELQEKGKPGTIDPIPTNYGAIAFHYYGFIDEELLKWCGKYLTENQAKRIKRLSERDQTEDDARIILSDEIDDGILCQMACDHPEILESGCVEIFLSMIDFETGYVSEPQWSSDLDETRKRLRHQLEKIEQLGNILEQFSGSVYHLATWGDTGFEDVGYSIHLSLEFDADETLEELEKEIDEAIGPVKKYVERQPRHDLLLRGRTCGSYETIW